MSAAGLETWLADKVIGIVTGIGLAILAAARLMFSSHKATNDRVTALDKHVAENYAKRVDLSDTARALRDEVSGVSDKIDRNHSEVMSHLLNLPRH